MTRLEPDRPSYDLAQLAPGAEPPTIDGDLSDAVWASAAVIDDLRQVVPIAGGEPSQRTEVRLLRGPRALFMAVRCFDDNPSGIRATQMERDANLDPDDRVEIVFDTFDNQRGGYWFQIGPAGGMGDALIGKSGGSFNKDWDGIWYADSRIDALGWTAEFAFPYRTLDFDPASDSWGFNIRRLIRRNTEEARWSSPDPANRFFAPVFSGRLDGTAGLEKGLGIDLKPFFTADYLRDDETGDRDRLLDGGLDLFWSISPSTKLSLSVNTDFAEAEADGRQVNLTRFSLFFPEKRDFFLEDSSAFVFGPGGFGSRDVLPFFSRTIGLDAERETVPLLGAAKLVSRTERFSLGLLDVQTEAAGDLPSKNLFVLRGSAALGEQSDAGLILTRGDPASDLDSQTYGADLNLRTSTLFGNRNGRFSAYWLNTDSDTSDGDGESFLIEVAYPNDEVDLSASVRSVDEDFSPALGFVRRNGIRRYESSLSYRPRLNGLVRRLIIGVDPSITTDRDGNVIAEELGLSPFGIDFESDDEVRLLFEHERDVLADPFEIVEGIEIPSGDFQFLRYGARFQSSDKRPFSASLRTDSGQFFDGHSNEYNLGVEWRPNAHFNIDLDYEYRAVRLPAGAFDVHVAAADLAVQFSPELVWSNLLQYDNQSRDLGWNSRVRWIVQPGNELFFVINQSWLAGAGSFIPGDGQATLKVGWTFRI